VSAVRHGACLVRATAIDLAILAAHLLLYPTGILPEHLPAAAPRDLPGDPYGTLGTPAAHLGHPATAAGANAGPDPATHAVGAPYPPVLLLHGFVDNRSAFTLLRRSLSRHGWTHVQAVNYSPFTPDLRTAAEQLGAHVERACAQSGRSRVDIVAHSLGGLIARYYVQCLGGDARVRTLVTLGTPHSGTRAVPSFTPHPLARQMRPASPVLTELAAPAPGCRTRFVAFWSDLDQLMIPVGSARLEHADLLAENVHITGIGHLALPVHAPVAAEIRRALGERLPPGGETHAA
jgi:pimeloyl-ACP methyl ester carboxylesterase